jgi:hypothetical protein
MEIFFIILVFIFQVRLHFYDYIKVSPQNSLNIKLCEKGV